MADPKAAGSEKRTTLQVSWQTVVFAFAASMLAIYLVLWLLGMGTEPIAQSFADGSASGESEPSWWLAKLTWQRLPLLLAILIGGLPLVWELVVGAFHGQFGSDLLAAVSIVTSLVLGEYLAGTIVVMMLSGGQALESYAVRNASSVLNALAQRMPSVAHRLVGNELVAVPLDEVEPDELIIVGAHETCPVDGVVVEGHGAMDESYLSGEPYRVPKSVGSAVMSGAINGQSVLKVRVTRRAVDSRYAKIMQVMQDSAQRKPNLRRLGDLLGAWYTPLALIVAVLAWWSSGEVIRFLAVLVVATPCPLLLGIPIAVIGTISLAARRNIIVKDPAVLEQIALVKTALFDKTGTLTYGRPTLSELILGDGFERTQVLSLAASLEQYSRHPLSGAVQEAARRDGAPLIEASSVSEVPGRGLTGLMAGHQVWITSRKLLAADQPGLVESLPPRAGGMECLVVVDGRLAGLLSFRDEIRRESTQFIQHLSPRHGIARTLLVSGDREEEVRYLADHIGTVEIHAGQSPEQKVEITRRETEKGPTMFVGDGINDAPALAAATIGVAFGAANEITSEAADIVVLDASLQRVDELLHIGVRMRRIALESAVGGMALSMGGMLLAAAGYLPPVAGAVAQEIIDVAAILNALRALREAPPSTIQLRPADTELLERYAV
ncbi:MAG: heavy metal translocating P-type ATPase, partial [Aureliella sp.]